MDPRKQLIQQLMQSQQAGQPVNPDLLASLGLGGSPARAAATDPGMSGMAEYMPEQASMREYHPTMRDKVGQGMEWFGDKIGMPESTANRMGREAQTGADFVPVLGDAIAAQDAAQAWDRGDYGTMALAGASLIPGAGDVAAKGGKAAKKAISTALTSDAVYAKAAEGAKGKLSFSDFRKSGRDVKGTLFDYSKMDQVPDRAQFPLERYDPPRGPSERVVRALGNPEVEKQLVDYVERGRELGGTEWYNTEPFRKVFDEEWGGNADQTYANYMDVMAATSPRSKVPDNVRTQSHYWHELNRGIGDNSRKNMPIGDLSTYTAELSDGVPKGYGSVAQKLHRGNVDKLMSGGMDFKDNPKPISFSQNLQGNYDPVTVDTHNFRPLGMIQGDPDFLMKSFNPEKGVTERPLQDFQTGARSMDDLLKDPPVWEAKPRNNEYGYYEDWQKGKAAELGMAPAQFQSNMWIGAGDLTGLQSAPEPFLQTLEARVMYTAEVMGADPEEVLRAHVRGEIPLLSVGAGAGALGLAGLNNSGGGGGEGGNI